jgi:hypothetical protein
VQAKSRTTKQKRASSRKKQPKRGLVLGIRDAGAVTFLYVWRPPSFHRCPPARLPARHSCHPSRIKRSWCKHAARCNSVGECGLEWFGKLQVAVGKPYGGGTASRRCHSDATMLSASPVPVFCICMMLRWQDKDTQIGWTNWVSTHLPYFAFREDQRPLSAVCKICCIFLDRDASLVKWWWGY